MTLPRLVVFMLFFFFPPPFFPYLCIPKEWKEEKGREDVMSKNRKPRQQVADGVSVVGGRRTTFPRVTAVSSSRRGLTSLFGMVRGAPPRHSRHSFVHGLCRMGKADTRNTPHGAPRCVGGAGGSARAISAARLNVSPRSHLRPIDVVVSDGPLRRPHLGAGFALRCIQRLSRPDAATRPCAWRRNRLTVGPSDPVLSY